MTALDDEIELESEGCQSGRIKDQSKIGRILIVVEPSRTAADPTER